MIVGHLKRPNGYKGCYRIGSLSFPKATSHSQSDVQLIINFSFHSQHSFCLMCDVLN